MLQYSSSAALFSLHTNVRPRVCEALSSALQAASAANPRYLHCFQRCALKGVPEAIFERMGVVWNRCAAPRRQLSREAGVRDSAVCWNATDLTVRLVRPFGQVTVSALQGCHARFGRGIAATQGGAEAAGLWRALSPSSLPGFERLTESVVTCQHQV